MYSNVYSVERCVLVVQKHRGDEKPSLSQAMVTLSQRELPLLAGSSVGTHKYT